MNYKQSYFQNTIDPLRKSPGRNGSSISTVMDDGTVIIRKTSENHLMLRLQEMEKYNVSLEKLVEQRTKKLAEVAKTNAKFISIIAHDLRSPFNTIIYALKLLNMKLEALNIDDIENYIKLASNSAINTLNLLDNLLIWTITQSEEKSFKPVTINLKKLVIDEIDNINNTALQKHIKLTHAIPPNLNVTADIQMTKSIFRNLVNNAIKFTGRGGTISVSASDGNRFVEIVVSDTGIGISQAAQKKLFKTETFHSTTGTDNEKGTGLGLKICKEFVEKNGGKILIESTPGKGSNFRFTLPKCL